MFQQTCSPHICVGAYHQGTDSVVHLSVRSRSANLGVGASTVPHYIFRLIHA